MSKKELSDFAKRHIEHGYTKDDVKQKLIEFGHDADAAEMAVTEAISNQAKPGAKFLAAVLGIAVLMLLIFLALLQK